MRRVTHLSEGQFVGADELYKSRERRTRANDDTQFIQIIKRHILVRMEIILYPDGVEPASQASQRTNVGLLLRPPHEVENSHPMLVRPGLAAYNKERQDSLTRRQPLDEDERFVQERFNVVPRLAELGLADSRYVHEDGSPE